MEKVSIFQSNGYFFTLYEALLDTKDTSENTSKEKK